MKDVFGRGIEAGHIIAFAGTAGRSAELRFYRIEEVKSDGVKCRELLRGWKTSFYKDTAVDGKWKERCVGLSDSNRMMVIPAEHLDHLG